MLRQRTGMWASRPTRVAVLWEANRVTDEWPLGREARCRYAWAQLGAARPLARCEASSGGCHPAVEWARRWEQQAIPAPAARHGPPARAARRRGSEEQVARRPAGWLRSRRRANLQAARSEGPERTPRGHGSAGVQEPRKQAQFVVERVELRQR